MERSSLTIFNPQYADAAPSSEDPGSSPSTTSQPSCLTARETEVLRLLAQGLTNKQIAQRLVIAPLTAQSHIRSIYQKLGVSTRIAATRYAIDQNIV